MQSYFGSDDLDRVPAQLELAAEPEHDVSQPTGLRDGSALARDHHHEHGDAPAWRVSALTMPLPLATKQQAGSKTRSIALFRVIAPTSRPGPCTRALCPRTNIEGGAANTGRAHPPH